MKPDVNNDNLLPAAPAALAWLSQRYPGPYGIAVKLSKFAAVGAIGTLAHYTVLVAAVELANTEVVIGSSVGALTGAFVNYFLNRSFTFQSKKKHREALGKFLVVAAGGFVLNGILMGLFSYGFQWPYLVAQIVTTLLVLAWNFIGNLLWTFAH